MIDLSAWLPDKRKILIRPNHVSIMYIDGLLVTLLCDGQEYSLAMENQAELDNFLDLII